MTLLSGLIYNLPYEHLDHIKQTKSYMAQHKTPNKRSIFGYKVIKLDQDVTYKVGWRENDMKEFHAKKGEYLTQCPGQPPNIIKTWSELQATYRVFRNNRYRYITSGLVDVSKPLSSYRLVGGVNLNPIGHFDTVIRVRIPDDIKLEKYSCDNYSTTSDKRTIKELGYDIMAYYVDKERWVIHNELDGMQPHEMTPKLKELYGYDMEMHFKDMEYWEKRESK